MIHTITGLKSKLLSYWRSKSRTKLFVIAGVVLAYIIFLMTYTQDTGFAEQNKPVAKDSFESVGDW